MDYFVTLKILSSLNARSTERPNDPPLTLDHTTSNILPQITYNKTPIMLLVKETLMLEQYLKAMGHTYNYQHK